MEYEILFLVSISNVILIIFVFLMKKELIGHIHKIESDKTLAVGIHHKKIDELNVELAKLREDFDLFFEHFDMIENKLGVRGRDPRLQKKVDELRKDENE